MREAWNLPLAGAWVVYDFNPIEDSDDEYEDDEHPGEFRRQFRRKFRRRANVFDDIEA